MSELIVQETRFIPPTATSVVNEFLRGRKATTRRAYAGDLQYFATFIGAADAEEGARLFLERGRGEANAVVLSYRNYMVEKKLASNTTNRRLAAIRSLVRMARMVDLVPWSIDVQNVKAKAYRDTSGPGLPAVQKMITAAGKGKNKHKALRDVAMLRLMADCGLRRAEVLGLDVCDYDTAGKVRILGKGRSEKEWVSLPGFVHDALSAWLGARGITPGPLFTNFDRGGRSGRLTGSALYSIVKKYGTAAGVDTRPHGLRHAAITSALDAFNGDVRKVAAFSRHSDLRVLTRYDDNRHDFAGEVAAVVSLKNGRCA